MVHPLLVNLWEHAEKVRDDNTANPQIAVHKAASMSKVHAHRLVVRHAVAGLIAEGLDDRLQLLNSQQINQSTLLTPQYKVEWGAGSPRALFSDCLLIIGCLPNQHYKFPLGERGRAG